MMRMKMDGWMDDLQFLPTYNTNGKVQIKNRVK